jgi:hypothetical protein
MAKTVFTTITLLPPLVTRETVLATLHDHLEMIELNPSHEEHHMTKPPPEATPEEYHCHWYSITDKVSYLPARMVTSKIKFTACFHNLAMGVQIHVYAPMGLDIREKWTLYGNLPNEPVQPPEIGIGAPISGLYLREDVEIRCNFLLTRFVKRRFKDSCATLVARLLVKSQLQEAVEGNRRLTNTSSQQQQFFPPLSLPLSPPVSVPYTASLNGEMRPARAQDEQRRWARARAQDEQRKWAQDEQRRCAYESRSATSPTFSVPNDPSGYERIAVTEMDAGPKGPVELPEA